MKTIKREANETYNILIVEDSPTQAEQLKYSLEQHGYDVAVTCNGKEALSYLSEHKPQMVISDILMPEMDGFELCHIIKSDEKKKNIPVILLTSLSDPADIIRGLLCAADNFIVKPYADKYLLSRIEYIRINHDIRKSGQSQLGVEIYFAGQRHSITSDRLQILDLLLSTYETAVRKNCELEKSKEELSRLNAHLEEKVEERTAALTIEVTERKQAEETLRKVNRALRMLSECNGIIVHNDEEKVMAEKICHAITTIGEYQSAWIAFTESNDSRSIRPIAIVGSKDCHSPEKDSVWFKRDPDSPLSEALETGKVIVCNDILVDERSSPLWAEAERLGCRSYVILPLVTDGQALGLIQICSKETNRYDDEELKLLYEMREDVAYAIVSIRTEKERLRSEEALKESEAKLKDAQALARIGSWNFEIESQKITWSDQTHKLYGRNPALGPPTVEEEAAYYSPEQVQMLREYSRRAIEEGKCFEYDLEAKLLDGKHVYFSATMRPLKDAHGKVVELFGTVQDITERKLAEEELRQSKEFAANIISSSIDMIIAVDKERRITEFNKAAEESFGYKCDEVLGKHVNLLYADPEAGTKIHTKTVEQERCVHEVLNKRKNGELFTSMLSSSVLRDLHDELIGVMGISRDITGRKRAEEALRDSEARYRMLFEASADGILIADLETKVFKYANPAVCRMLGHTVEELRTLGLADIHPKQDLQRVIAEFEAQVRGEKTLASDLPCLRKDGTIFYADVNATTVAIDNRQCLVGFFRDITERKQAEETLNKERNLVRALMDNVPDNIYFKDTDSHFIAISKALAERFNLSDRAQAVGKTDFDFFTEEHARPAFEAEQTIIRTGQPIVGIEEKETWPDGRETWVSTTKMPLRDKEGNIVGTFGISRDITERKLTEEALRETKDYLENLLSFANAPIMVWDSNFKITRFNVAFEKLTGYSMYDVIGKHPEMLFPAEMREDLSALITRTSDGENLISVEMPVLCKDGSTRIVLWNTANIYTADEKTIIATIAHGQDVTKQKSLQNQLMQTQKVQSIGTLAGGIAHDFNNILGIILAYTSILERSEGDNEKILKSTTAITQAISRGAALVRQILTFARQTGVLMIPMSIPELIYELAVMLKETFPQVIEFQMIIEKNIPFINADHAQMHQVLLNLCVNARDAMPKGGTLSIEVKTVSSESLIQQFPTAENDRYISISVSDTGIGMDEATISRIFDPFFTTKEQGEGTGLGLSVVYGVIQEHHGFISVESKVGQGTTFHLYLPVLQEEKKIQDVQKAKTEGIHGGSETILFVEDEQLLREVVQSTLESNGYKVLIATNGREAIEIYKKQYKTIALVLSDMGLPKLTGIDAYAMFKEINPDVKVIFASGFISLETRSELLKEGAKGFIMKPYNVNEVLQMVREVLNEKEE